MNFTNKVIVVTGASKGFGLAMAKAFIAEYMQVDYAVGKVMENFKAATPEQDLVIKRPTAV